MTNDFQSTFQRKLIYIFRINDKAHEEYLKVGDTSIDDEEEVSIEELVPNCKILNQAAKKRIDSYTKTAAIPYELLYTELAVYKNKSGKLQTFRDYQVREVLKRSGINPTNFSFLKKPSEWHKTDLQTAINAIKAVKEDRKSLFQSEKTFDRSPIVFRPDQNEAIKQTIKRFEVDKNSSMLWNAKMRFGKTLTALEVVKRMKFKKTIILTHRPVVSEGWFEDFDKIFYEKDSAYKFGSKNKGITKAEVKQMNYVVYFASIQDLRGSQTVGGKFDKNDELFSINWDLVVIDEAHEGTLTDLGRSVIQHITENDSDGSTRILRLSGTPFNILSEYQNDDIFTWDYVMEQKAKKEWPEIYGDTYNPYIDLPQMNIYTYSMKDIIRSGGTDNYVDIEDKAFNFKEFFRVWTGEAKKDKRIMSDSVQVGDFIHQDDVMSFLNQLTNTDDNNYPYANKKYRQYFKHSLWMVPGVKEAKALRKLMEQHPVFGSGQFRIVNVAGQDDEEDFKNALKNVKEAINNSRYDYSITLSCGKLTTGVTVPEWTAVFMLAGSAATSASSYLQTIFRVQSPGNIDGMIKEQCYVFDFAPDRTLKMIAEAGKLQTKPGSSTSDVTLMGDFLNFCPVIAISGSSMRKYDVDSMLQQIKKAYASQVVQNGFDSKYLYNERLLQLNNMELEDFEKLKAIIGKSKQTKKINEVDVNHQGLTGEEYEILQTIDRTLPNELTPEQIAVKEKATTAQKQKATAISILRGISIRIPLLIYGATLPFDEEITIDDFTDKVDDLSWAEFMPSGVTKELFAKYKKYYDADIFIGAGRQIRNVAKAADSLPLTERVIKIARLFLQFKNPDKETVLTPWRVVNMHLSDCLGGYDFFDEKHEEMLEKPRYVDQGQVTKDVFDNPEVKILEINSKTGLYPLYAAYSVCKNKLKNYDQDKIDDELEHKVWKETVENNIFVICKTPMAKSITKRTLIGYNDDARVSAHAFDDLINQIKNKPEAFVKNVQKASFWNKEGNEEMKFDAIIGNPPYQGSNHQQIYPDFYLTSIKLGKYVSLIFPTGWQEPKNGNNLKKMNNEMIKTDRQIVFIDKRQNVFPGISGAEWINILFWQKEFDNGLNGKQLIYTNGENPQQEQLLWQAESITKPQEIIVLSKIVLDREDFVSLQINTSVLKPYGLRTDVFKEYDKYNLQPFFDEKKSDNDIKIYGKFGVVKYAPKNYKFPKKTKSFDKYKVFVPYAWGNMSKKSQLLGGAYANIILARPYEICTETYQESGCFDNLNLAKKHAKYLMTTFVRALLYVNKASQHSTTAWGSVPIQDYSESWWDKTIAEIDMELFRKYNVPSEIITFIQKKIQKRGEDNINNYLSET